MPPTTAVDLDRTKGLPDLDSDCYYGLPSNPISIYHTGKPWPKPTGPESQRVPKEARPISIHPIAHVWRVLGRQIYEYFDSIDIKWTSIDPVRFAEVGNKDAGPLFIWVGVMPKTLSRKDAENAAVRCKQILARFQITSVEIAFRESISHGLLAHSSSTTNLRVIQSLLSTMTQLLIFEFHLLLYSVFKLLPDPSPTFKALVVFTFAKVANTIGSSSLQPAMLFSR